MLRQYSILCNPTEIKDIVIVERDKGNGVVTLDRTFDNNTIQKLFSDRPKFKKLKENQTLKREASLQCF